MEVGRIQTLALDNLKEIPPQFIRPANERPENTKALEGVTVPLISLSQPHDLLVKEIAEAASKWGFFQVTDHGISHTLIQRLQEVGKEFFSLPRVEKEAYANDPSNGKFEGYGTKMTKNLEEKIEWVDYFFHIMLVSKRGRSCSAVRCHSPPSIDDLLLQQTYGLVCLIKRNLTLSTPVSLELRKYIHDLSHVVELDDVRVKENLTFEKLLVTVIDHNLKELRASLTLPHTTHFLSKYSLLLFSLLLVAILGS
ncbi:flavonol synthase/flavanone 3-hydroxylase-like [Cajanus cajan]|uniref:flavonol synthase/flavanone 3-hydroxylase-like n=1 Tax=Cajanus cajan TaxID=3821 RepID=UPI0010FB1223|nr:flavonol synthase/flavanone 3-hydroxylase-like [Cajanus cajan]